MTGKAKNQRKTKSNKRYDNKGRVLQTGELQLASGTYRFKKTVNGKEYYANGKTLEEMRTNKQKLLLEIADGICLDGNDLLVDVVFDAWFSAKRGISQKSKEEYHFRYTNYIQKQFGNRKLKSITKLELKRYYNQLFDSGISFSTINAANQVFHQIFAEAIENKYTRDDPTIGVLKELNREAKKKPSSPKALTREQQEIFLSALKNHKNHHHYYNFFAFLVETGLRVGEAAGLQWDSVDMDNDKIYVEYSLGVLRGYEDNKGYRRVMHEPKTENGRRMVPLTNQAKLMLQIEKAKGIPCKESIDGFSNFVFLNSKGSPYHFNTLNAALEKVVKDYNATVKDEALKLPHITCHTFRHTCTTRLIEDGINPIVAQKLIGHADARTTIDIYTHISENTVVEAMKQREKVQNQKKSGKTDFVPNFVPEVTETTLDAGNIIYLPWQKDVDIRQKNRKDIGYS